MSSEEESSEGVVVPVHQDDGAGRARQAPDFLQLEDFRTSSTAFREKQKNVKKKTTSTDAGRVQIIAKVPITGRGSQKMASRSGGGGSGGTRASSAPAFRAFGGSTDARDKDAYINRLTQEIAQLKIIVAQQQLSGAQVSINVKTASSVPVSRRISEIRWRDPIVNGNDFRLLRGNQFEALVRILFNFSFRFRCMRITFSCIHLLILYYGYCLFYLTFCRCTG